MLEMELGVEGEEVPASKRGACSRETLPQTHSEARASGTRVQDIESNREYLECSQESV